MTWEMLRFAESYEIACCFTKEMQTLNTWWWDGVTCWYKVIETKKENDTWNTMLDLFYYYVKVITFEQHHGALKYLITSWFCNKRLDARNETRGRSVWRKRLCWPNTSSQWSSFYTQDWIYFSHMDHRWLQCQKCPALSKSLVWWVTCILTLVSPRSSRCPLNPSKGTKTFDWRYYPSRVRWWSGPAFEIMTAHWIPDSSSNQAWRESCHFGPRWGIGVGAKDQFDAEDFDVDFAYTVDGVVTLDLQYENLLSSWGGWNLHFKDL